MNIEIIILEAIVGTVIIWAMIGWNICLQAKFNLLQSKTCKSLHNRIAKLEIAKLEFQAAHIEWADAVSKTHFRKVEDYKDYIKNRKVKR